MSLVLNNRALDATLELVFLAENGLVIRVALLEHGGYLAEKPEIKRPPP